MEDRASGVGFRLLGSMSTKAPLCMVDMRGFEMAGWVPWRSIRGNTSCYRVEYGEVTSEGAYLDLRIVRP